MISLLIKYFSDIMHNMSHYDINFYSNKSSNPPNPNNLYILGTNCQVSYHGTFFTGMSTFPSTHTHIIHLKNSNFVVFQKTSKHYLISFFFTKNGWKYHSLKKPLLLLRDFVPRIMVLPFMRPPTQKS